MTDKSRTQMGAGSQHFQEERIHTTIVRDSAPWRITWSWTVAAVYRGGQGRHYVTGSSVWWRRTDQCLCLLICFCYVIFV